MSAAGEVEASAERSALSSSDGIQKPISPTQMQPAAKAAAAVQRIKDATGADRIVATAAAMLQHAQRMAGPRSTDPAAHSPMAAKETA